MLNWVVSAQQISAKFDSIVDVRANEAKLQLQVQQDAAIQRCARLSAMPAPLLATGAVTAWIGEAQ